MTRIVKVTTVGRASEYPIRISGGSLERIGYNIKKNSGSSIKKLAIVSNQRVFDLYGQNVVRSIASAGFETSVFLVGDGERHKNLKSVEKIVNFLIESGISRSDGVIGLGGGVVGDAAGFAASIYMRGVPLFQVPTTMLSMIDSSVGGKTGVNTRQGKNLIGSFYQPKGVFIDPEVLVTLPSRELTSGLCEAIKQGILDGPDLFERTSVIVSELRKLRLELARSPKNLFSKDFEEFLSRQIAFKARITAGDEKESLQRTDPNSRKILNFGHTFAHALESVTNYRRFKHGEAVGHGIILASLLSKNLGLLGPKVVNLLCDVVHRAGKLPSITNIDPNSILEAIRFDKKNVKGNLHWVLLEGIGNPKIVPHNLIGDPLVRRTLKEFISKS